MTLRRYLTRLFGGRALATLLALAALLLLLDLLDRSTDVLARGGGVADIARYAALRLPTLVGHAVPLAVLVGAVLALGSLAARSEIAALRATGIGAWRLFGALLPACALAAATQLALLLGAAPRTERALADWWASRGAVSADTPVAGSQRLWFRNGGEIVAVDAVSPDGARLEGVLVVRREADAARIAARLEARRAEHGGAAGWTLREVSVVRPAQARAETVDGMAWPDGPSPGAMRDLARPTEAQSPDRLLAGARGEGAVARGAAYYRTRAHAAVAMLATPFVMLLLAMPAAFALPRGSGSGGAARPAAVGVALGLGFLAAAGLLGALGEASLLPPVLAAWTAPLLFAALGIALLQREEG